MGALEAVLQLKAQEKQQEQFRSEQITQAVELFQRAKQASQENQFKSLLTNAQIQNINTDNAYRKSELDLKAQGIDIQKQEVDLRKQGINLKEQANQRQNKLADAFIENNIQRNSLQSNKNTSDSLLAQARIDASKELALLKSNQDDKKFKSVLEQKKFENDLKVKQQGVIEKYLKNISAPTAPAVPEENANPTLADAFPEPKQEFIQTPYVSSNGNVGMSNRLDPSYNKKIERRNANIKDLEEYSKPVESFAVGIQQLRDAIANTPPNAEGFLSKPRAKLNNMKADINNEKWYTDYNLAYQQNLLPSAQALGSSKVLSDRDLENIKQSLGDYSTPKELKIKALDQLTKKIGEAAKTKLNAYGVDKNLYSKIYPNTAREFGLSSKSDEGKQVEPGEWDDAKKARYQAWKAGKT